MAFGSAVEKTLELIAVWEDRGYDKGVLSATQKAELFKKTVRDLIKTMAGIAAVALGGAAAILKMIQAGAEVKSVADSFYGFVDAAGMAPDTLDRIRSAIHKTVSDMAIMQSSIRALSGGLEPGRLIEFWEKAKQIGDVSSRDTREVFDSLTLSMNKLETQTLETIGITLKMDDAMQDYADSIKKKVSELSFQDKQMAFSIALEKKYQDSFLSVGNVTTKVREKFQNLTTSVANLKDKFFQTVAESPGVQKFLDDLIAKANGLYESLDSNRDVIGEVVDKIILLIDRVIEFGDKLGKVAANIKKFEAPLKGLAAGMIGAKVGGWVAAILAATGVISGGTIPIIAGAVAAIAGLGVTGVEAFKNMREAAEQESGAMLKAFVAMYDEIERKQMNLSDWARLGGPNERAPEPEIPDTGPGGNWNNWQSDIYMRVPPPTPPAVDIARPELVQMTAEEEAYLEFLDRKKEATEETADYLTDLEGARVERSAFLQNIELELMRRNLQAREYAYARAFQVMGNYSAKFFEHGAKMNKALSAMAVAGFSEMVASYIEAKTTQARFDFMEASYQTLKYLASGNLYAAGLMAQAAAGAGAVAGLGMVAAGAVRSWGASKAESIMDEDEGDYGYDSSEDSTGDKGAARKEASGVVQQRPVRIFINTTVSISAGAVVFGDSETGLEGFYQDYLHGLIQDDLDRGALEVA